MSSAVPTDDEEGRGTMQRHRNTAWDSSRLPAYQTPTATQHSRACPGWRRRVCKASRGWINSVVYWPVQIKSRAAGPVYTHRLPWSISKQARDAGALRCIHWIAAIMLSTPVAKRYHSNASPLAEAQFSQQQLWSVPGNSATKISAQFRQWLDWTSCKKICWPF